MPINNTIAITMIQVLPMSSSFSLRYWVTSNLKIGKTVYIRPLNTLKYIISGIPECDNIGITGMRPEQRRQNQPGTDSEKNIKFL